MNATCSLPARLSRHRGLDLTRRPQGNRDAAPRRAGDRDRGRLSGTHDGAHVVLAEDPLDRDHVGPMTREPSVDANLKRQ
jgi:hypothetical protein